MNLDSLLYPPPLNPKTLFIAGLLTFKFMYTLLIHKAPSAGAVEQVTVDVLSSTSVNVSWLPSPPRNWNGVITCYTVEYELIRLAGSAMGIDSSGIPLPMSISIPTLGQPLSNNPDPIIVSLPLKRESIVISGLQEFSVYQFSVYYENSMGRSDGSNLLEQETTAGTT